MQGPAQQVTLNITDSANFVLYDQTYISLAAGLSTAYVFNQDALKTFNSDSTLPQLYSLSSDDSALFSNGYGDFTSCTDIRLGFRVRGGTYYISASSITNFDPASIIQLEDKTLGVFHNLRTSNYSVAIAQPEQSETRFVLHISYPPIITTTAAGCNNDDGVISINQDCIAWTKVDLFFAGQIVHSYNNATGIFNFNGLEEGSYIVAFTFGNYTTTLPVTLTGHQIQARINASALNAVTGDTIQFSAITTNTTGFEWDFGEGTQITGVANPDFFYEEPGTYTVTLIATNSFGCSDTATVVVVITQGMGLNNSVINAANIICRDKNLFVHLSQPVNSAVLDVFSDEGKNVFHSAFADSNSYDLSALANGIYIISLSESGHRFSQKLLLQE